MIGIIDYGMGNLGSVSNACRFLDIDATVITRPDEMSGCNALILPGVGAFGDCMRHLREHGFVDVVKEWISADKPFLGICLGLHMLFEASEESPGVEGLGIFPGKVRRFSLPSEWKIPQIGWNKVQQNKPGCPLFSGIGDDSFFYFVHSYYVESKGHDWEAGLTDYGITYTSTLWQKNVMAVQFHPEKSQKTGLAMLRNFSEWIEHKG